MSHYTKQNRRKTKINIAQNLNYTIKGENILPDLRACSKPWGREEIQYKCRKNIFQLLQKAPFQLATNVPFLTGTVPFNYTIFFLFKFHFKKLCWPDYLYGRPFQSQSVSKLLPFPRSYNQYISIWWHANITLQFKYVMVLLVFFSI